MRGLPFPKGYSGGLPCFLFTVNESGPHLCPYLTPLFMGAPFSPLFCPTVCILLFMGAFFTRLSSLFLETTGCCWFSCLTVLLNPLRSALEGPGLPPFKPGAETLLFLPLNGSKGLGCRRKLALPLCLGGVFGVFFPKGLQKFFSVIFFH